MITIHLKTHMDSTGKHGVYIVLKNGKEYNLSVEIPHNEIQNFQKEITTLSGNLKNLSTEILGEKVEGTWREFERRMNMAHNAEVLDGFVGEPKPIDETITQDKLSNYKFFE